MQQVIVDCLTKQAIVVELTLDEIAFNEADRQRNLQRELIKQRKVNKRLIVGKLVELREMKQNRDIFDTEDIAELQGEIDELKSRLL